MLSPGDIHAIEELVNRYGHIIDERQYSRVRELFAADAVYDVTDFDSGIHRGAAAIAALWAASESKHPLAHHATNIVISEDPDGTVRVVSKGIGIRAEGRPSTVVYRDAVVRTADGWRIALRVAVRRRPENIPAPS